MLALRTTLIVCVLMAVIVGVCVDAHKRTEKRDLNIVQAGTPQGDSWICQNMAWLASWFNVDCNHPATAAPSNGAPTTAAPTTSKPMGSSSAGTPLAVATSTVGSPLERITWCRLSNGSYLAMNQRYLYDMCTIATCQENRLIAYEKFKCMTTLCLDYSTATNRTGQCCTQCSSDVSSAACVYGGVAYPHGVIVRDDKTMKCWCQWGQFECRTGVAQLFDSLDLWGDGTAIYIILVVVGTILIFGTLLCLGSTFFFYYYYQRHQQAFQQVYDQYYNNSAGWQPMADQEGLAEVSMEDKQAEAEQGQFESEEYLAETEKDSSVQKTVMPPPYALYNGAYVSEEQHNNQKKL